MEKYKVEIEYTPKKLDGSESANAFGIYDFETRETTILKGSTFLNREIVSTKDVQPKREKLEKAGIIDVEKREFLKNYVVKPKRNDGSTSLSAAATIIYNGRVNIRACFKLKDTDFYIFNWIDMLETKSLDEVWEDLQNVLSGKEVEESSESEASGEAEPTIEIEAKKELDSVNRKIAETVEDKGYLSQNVIFYGVPGSGKSHKINELLCLDTENSLDNKYYKRILFHPEYSYGDFVGQLVPKVSKDKEVTYEFKAGPFVSVLKAALEDEENHYFLVIEEINRGNAPAIFGDLFQLLDRKNGQSEYPIDNEDVVEKLNENSKVEVDKVYIPKNLTIFATMNTCDQNVFTLDTAFKRRFRMSRIENKFEYTDNEKSVLNRNAVITFKNGKAVTWLDFALALNKEILEHCNDGTSAEDKQLGTYFVKKEEIDNITWFAEKVLMYLWNDVVKYEKSQLFVSTYKSLDNLIEAFVSGVNVFNSHCKEVGKLYSEISKESEE